MVDQAKRKSLKNIARAGVGAATAAASTGALANMVAHAHESGVMPAQINSELSEIEVATRMSPVTNDIEVVLTNKGALPARITDMTPAEIKTARGTFDFNSLTANGDLHLAANESVTVPLQYHPVVLDASGVTQRTNVLSKALAQNVSIVTDSDSLAAVSIVSNL